jgi:predicted AAA+ superfamily ATPase
MMLHLFSRYYSQGGIPEYIRTEIKDALHKLYEGILFRDIITRFKLKEQKAIQKMVFFLASNLSKPCSFKSICSITGLKSATTISEYSYYLEQAYLCFFLNRYSHSLKEQEQSPKKVYFIDHILAKTVGFQISANYGRALENIVFIELKRRGKEIYYHKEKKECDFLIKNEEAYQVCASWRDLTTKEREVEGLLEAMEIYNLAEGYILTEDQEETIQAQGKMIHVIPLWKWLTR